MKSDLIISGSEWKVMRIIWTIGKVTSSQLIDILQETTDWSPSTVKTLLARLVNKGALNAEKSGRSYVYSAKVGELESMEDHVADLFDNMCAMKIGSALIDSVDKLPISQNDIKDLISALEKKEKSAPKEVQCDCLPADYKVEESED